MGESKPSYKIRPYRLGNLIDAIGLFVGSSAWRLMQCFNETEGA